MIVTPTQIRVTEDRRQDLLAAVDYERRFMAAARRVPAATPPRAGRFRAGLRHAVATLVALAAID
jgi:hypothetical protein